MARPLFHLAFAAFCLLSRYLLADAAVVEHTFHVGNLTVQRLGQTQVITAVNGQLPGPKIEARNGDTVVVHVVNLSPYNITIHWHGILQLLSSWADGPNMVSQCPIRPAGGRYTYRFNVTGQEGTLWWHAHVSFLRATVYGALLLRPAPGARYPFPMPHHEATLLLGEWWNASVVDVERQALLAGGAPNNSVALTINGLVGGDLYKDDPYQLTVERGQTYLLRIINAALNYQLFFKVAGHSFTVVAADACYTDPYDTDVIVIAPGQTVDALMRADAEPGRYYMAAQVYQSVANATYSATTRAVVTYDGLQQYEDSPAAEAPATPRMPALNDSATAQSFYGSLTGLLQDGKPTVPLHVDTRMLVTFGLGVTPCAPAQTLCNRTLGSVAASMNNVSFQFPTTMSLLEAHMRGAPEGVYTRDFPDRPPVMFDFTSSAASTNRAVMFTTKGTKVKTLRYNATVEVVLQNTAILGAENHPLHLHGFNFYVLAQGTGNFNAHRHVRAYNLVNPQQRNTVAVPAGGWAVIRFTADNPGVWIMHCHLDAHLPFGLAMAFEVEDGPTPDAVLPPPPPDYPQC
ncbi:laccase-14-like [Phragmites australis]|uniref:laccase-14-like n=1 Tax=Phragmites australis TaxID=29695 RepID=UPI002D7792B7|nr:laccase-14-like [Phragmites australis]